MANLFYIILTFLSISANTLSFKGASDLWEVTAGDSPGTIVATADVNNASCIRIHIYDIIGNSLAEKSIFNKRGKFNETLHTGISSAITLMVSLEITEIGKPQVKKHIRKFVMQPIHVDAV
jgi:hypothetical protein